MNTKSKPTIFQATWQAPGNIQTRITTSNPEFNIASHVNDNPDIVAKNREQLRTILPAEPQWLNQVHGTHIINLDVNNPITNTAPAADAAYTREANKVCVVMTADCLPILLSNINGDFVAAIHAGWRGLNSGIIEKMLGQLTKYAPGDILAFIGPAICQQCFEVDEMVKNEFLHTDPGHLQFFYAKEASGKYHANLRKIAEYKLLTAGLNQQNISNKDVCTKCNPQWFYSYRANPATGRIATLIWKT